MRSILVICKDSYAILSNNDSLEFTCLLIEFFERVGILLPIDMHHLPAGLRDDHLRAEVVELVPELLGLELALDVTQLVGVAGGP